MNKKILSVLVGILAIALVSAVATYYVLYSATFTINNINGMGDYTFEPIGEYSLGDVIVGDPIDLLNDLDSDRNLLITTNGAEGITTRYVVETELTEKTVDFSSDVWEIPEDADKVGIEYTLVGDSFTAEVVSGAVGGYVLVYYADNDNRFANPGQAVLVDNVLGNLPGVDDENADLNDYSAEYPTTPHGAKIWYVPSNALTLVGDAYDINWGRASEFFFESELIQFNSDGEITLYSGQNLVITPEYEVTNTFLEGEVTITTTIV